MTIIQQKLELYNQRMKNKLDQINDESELGFERIRVKLKECETIGRKGSEELSQEQNTGVLQKRRQRDEAFIINSEQSPFPMVKEKSKSFNVIVDKFITSNISQFKKVQKRGSHLKNGHQKWTKLKDVITNQKVNNLKTTFCNKIKRNNPYSRPIQYQYGKNISEQGFLYQRGIQFKEIYEKIISIFFVYNIISSIFLFTIWIVFPDVKQKFPIESLELVGLILYFIQVILNFVTVKSTLGKKLEHIKEISADYIEHKFPLDFFNLLFIFVHLLSDNSVIGYFRIVMFFKLQDCMEKIEKLQVYFIENYYNEQYWSLCKVFLFNFCFAHILAIFLLAMANVNTTNWMISKGIQNSPWYEQYIWSYYWATTIMLTIGFGDIVPSCYQQALCMIFIETISCIILAYNVNCVGSLISNIRSQDIQKSKNMKIFKKLIDKNDISQSLSWKINNYIQQHNNIKKLFNIQEQAQFVEKLPTAFRTDYLKQANKTIFQRVFFFGNLLQKTLFSLAERIEMKIAHPQQIIFSIEKDYDIFILKTGEIGYFPRKSNRKYSKYMFDKMKINQNDTPFLLNTNFITKNRSTYGIKSISYSILYCLQYDSIIQILRDSSLDFQLYCQQRDKHKKRIDQFQVFPCEFCPKERHTKFSCPKLHFLPLTEQIKNRYVYQEKHSKNERSVSFDRIQNPKQPTLSIYKINKSIYNQKRQEEEVSLQAHRIRQKRFVIDQLMTIGFQSTENNQYIQTAQMRANKKSTNQFELLSKMQAKLLEGTVEIIKTELNKSLGIEKGEDQIWLLDLDKLKNYKNYFAKNNPSNLTLAFSSQERHKRMVENKVYTALFKKVFKKKEEDKQFEVNAAKHIFKMNFQFSDV